jgi:hypothetical protein
VKEDNKRVVFTELYEHAIYISWLVGIFVGIHIEQIFKYSPPGVNEVPSELLISSHSHLLLMTILLYFLNRQFRSTISTRKWPHYWTEFSLVIALIGAVMYSVTKYLEGAVEYGNQLQMLWVLEELSYGNMEISSTIYALGIMLYIVLAMIARIMR